MAEARISALERQLKDMMLEVNPLGDMKYKTTKMCSGPKDVERELDENVALFLVVVTLPKAERKGNKDFEILAKGLKGLVLTPGVDVHRMDVAT